MCPRRCVSHFGVSAGIEAVGDELVRTYYKTPNYAWIELRSWIRLQDFFALLLEFVKILKVVFITLVWTINPNGNIFDHRLEGRFYKILV